MDCLGRSETQTTSDQLGPDKSGDNETWGLDSQVTEWTDEKHSLYLKSMEASFVNQLYSSVDVPAWRSLKRNNVTSSKQMHRPSGQFKVLRRGSWQKLNFERPEFQLNKTRNSQALSANPWIQHFKSKCKPKTLVPLNPPEVSDQNFIDEQIKGEKTSSICSSKILKTEKPDSSSRDQVSYDYKLQYCSGKFRLSQLCSFRSFQSHIPRQKTVLRSVFFQSDEDQECKWLVYLLKEVLPGDSVHIKYADLAQVQKRVYVLLAEK